MFKKHAIVVSVAAAALSLASMGVPSARADSAVAWGHNDYGQLGNGNTDDKHTPVDVYSLSSGITAIAGGNKHSLALQNGTVRSWGTAKTANWATATTPTKARPSPSAT